MKVLLCSDVEKLGWLGDIVDVKNGYARNYLIPHGLATIPTEQNIKALAEEKARRAEQRKLVREQKERLITSVQGAEVVLLAKANEQGHLFGSVTERDIAQNLRQQGFDVADEMIKMDGHIKELGVSEVIVRAGADLTATVRVVVNSQEQTVDATEENHISQE
jgi:large subunit ribosomal protein L9